MASTQRTGPSFGPAQAFCALVGPVLILAGILGFLGNSDFGGPDQRGTFLGLDVNGWHNLVHIATGVLLLAGVPSATVARAICAIFGGTYAVVAVLGFIDGSDVLGLIPIDGADNVLHAVLAVVALIAAAAPVRRRHAVEDDGRPDDAERYGAAYD